MYLQNLSKLHRRAFSTRSLKYLIIDGYDRTGRQDLVAGGATEAGHLFASMAETCTRKAGFKGSIDSQIVYPADPDFDIEKVTNTFPSIDGILWTGCSLTIHHEDDPRVIPQIELAKKAFEIGVPSFGSCWAAQIAVVAAGGRCAANPRGREMGVARKIQLTAEGRAHPMFTGKPSCFDAFTSHNDEITHIPRHGVHLASNAFTNVQAVAVSFKKGDFWAVQYHPEYNLKEMARLSYCRRQRLVDLGFFKSIEDVCQYVQKLEDLHRDPSRKDIAWMLGFDEDIMSEEIRLCETVNWISRLVTPRFVL